MEYVYLETQRILKLYGTRNPYELLDAIGAVTVFSDNYELNGLKGFCTIQNRTMYAVINTKLPENDMRIVAGHEAGHLILHKKEILTSPARSMKDFNFFDNSGKYEREANSFLADFLVPDEKVLDVVIDREGDYFSAAQELNIPPPLFAFKLYSMMQRGYNVRSPVDLDSGFLGNSAIHCQSDMQSPAGL